MRIGLLASVGQTIDAFFPEIVSYWRNGGHTVSIAAGTPSSKLESEVIKQLSRRPAIENIGAPGAIDAWATRKNLDVIVTNTAVASFAARARKQRVPVIYFCHGLHWNQGRTFSERAWQTLELVALRNTSGVVTINRDDMNWFSRRFPKERIAYGEAGVGVPLKQFPKVTPPPRDQPIKLVWIGEFSHRKRPFMAIEVARQFAAKNTPVTLEMFGRGPLLSEAADLVNKFGLNHSVKLAGWTSEASAEIGKAHALLHTASWEGLPRVTLEALAVGRKTFAFDVKGVRDVPEISLAKDADPGDLANRIENQWHSGDIELATDHRAELDDARVAEWLLAYFSMIVGNATKDGGVQKWSHY